MDAVAAFVFRKVQGKIRVFLEFFLSRSVFRIHRNANASRSKYGGVVAR